MAMSIAITYSVGRSQIGAGPPNSKDPSPYFVAVAAGGGLGVCLVWNTGPRMYDT